MHPGGEGEKGRGRGMHACCGGLLEVGWWFCRTVKRRLAKKKGQGKRGGLALS